MNFLTKIIYVFWVLGIFANIIILVNLSKLGKKIDAFYSRRLEAIGEIQNE